MVLTQDSTYEQVSVQVLQALFGRFMNYRRRSETNSPASLGEPTIKVLCEEIFSGDPSAEGMSRIDPILQSFIDLDLVKSTDDAGVTAYVLSDKMIELVQARLSSVQSGLAKHGLTFDNQEDQPWVIPEIYDDLFGEPNPSRYT